MTQPATMDEKIEIFRATLLEYNLNHDAFGRFTHASNVAGAPGALGVDDMVKIDAAVDSIISVDMGEANGAERNAVTRARNKFVQEFIPEDRRDSPEAKLLISSTSDWVGGSSGLGGTQMSIANNVMRGRAKHAGLSPAQMRTVESFNKDRKGYPSGDMMKAHNAMARFNSVAAKRQFGSGEITVYRGIHGDQAKTILAKASKGDTVRIDMNTLASLTSNINVAKDFKAVTGSSGLVIKSKINYRNIRDSWASDASLGGSGKSSEREIIASFGKMKMTGVIVDD